MSLIRPSMILAICFCCNVSSAQQKAEVTGFETPNYFLDNSIVTSTSDSGQYVLTLYPFLCKGYLCITKFIQKPVIVTDKISSADIRTISVIKPKFLTVHGNISYDFFYRSKMDTPFVQSNLQQHTERVVLDVVLKEKYPFRIAFTARQSNSPYFRNFFDPNLNFDRYAYTKNLKQAMIDKLMAKANDLPDLKKLQDSLADQLKKYAKIKINIESPATLQKIIEQRERGASAKLPGTSPAIVNTNEKALNKLLADQGKFKFISKYDSISRLGDSVYENAKARYEGKKREADSLFSLIQKNKSKIDSIKKNSQEKFNAAIQKIYKATDVKELNKLSSEYGLEENKPSKLGKMLGDIKSFSIGRGMVNYTELTAQNILVTGINVEYNPSYYVAFAAGKIDYRFRDFFNRSSKNNNQYLVLGRLGVGNKDRKAIIFTLFKGRKNQSEYALSDSFNNHVNIVGYSVETIYKKDEFTSMSAEFAKSTKPVTGNLNNNKQIYNLWDFNDLSNMGINIKVQTRIPETNTTLSGFYRKTGSNYQSFSLFSYNTNQTSWQGRVDQQLFKNKMTFTGMVRRNDFTNPFSEKTFRTNTTFTSVLLNVHFPKYPVLSLGYYPGTQIYLIDKERMRENAYYILNGTMTYSYFFNGTGMNSTVMYNRYFNRATDSGFVLYKGINYYASQIVFFKKIQLQGGYAYNDQPELKYYTLDASAEYAVKNILKFGAGLKYNKVAGEESYFGERVLLGINLKKFGSLQFQYEKSYLPTINQTLYPVEIGRVSWYKYF